MQSPRKRATEARPESPSAGDPEKELSSAREDALRLLAFQLRTRRDLVARLIERGHAESVAEGAVARLEAVGLVDDHAYAEGFIRRRLRLRPRPPALLRRELRARGVPKAAIDSALGVFADQLDEVMLARDVLGRQAYRWTKLEADVAARRARATLRRLGFSAAVIAQVLARPSSQSSH